MRTVKSFCCGCTLKTGTRILFWLGAIFATLLGVRIIFDTENNIQQNTQFSLNLRYVLTCAIIILGIHVMGIYAVEMKSPAFLKPYLAFLGFIMVLMIIYQVLWAVAIIISLKDLYRHSKTEGNLVTDVVAELVINEIVYLLILGFVYYFFIVVLSFYKELRREIPR